MASTSAESIIVAGEALIDLTPVPHGSGAAFVPHPGGSPFNVAVALGRLGVAASFLGSVSTDPFGRMLSAHLVDSGVAVDLVVPAAEPTAVAFVHVAEGAEPQYSFLWQGTATALVPPDRLPPLPAGAPLHAGSISLVLEPGATTLDALLRREARRRIISLDPNVRPGLIADRKAYLRRFAHWLELADIVKVSMADLAWLYPDELPDVVAARLLAAGPALVLVTAGADGAAAYTSTRCGRAGGRQVAVADTVGAGDAFTAAAIAWLTTAGTDSRAALTDLTDTDLAQLLGFANEVAGLTCTRPGCDPPHRADLIQPLDKAV